MSDREARKSKYLICLCCGYVFTLQEGAEHGRRMGDEVILCPSCGANDYGECPFSDAEIAEQLRWQEEIRRKGALRALFGELGKLLMVLEWKRIKKDLAKKEGGKG